MSKLLEMKGISKSFYGVSVLNSVDFSINSGEVIALCGENGAGKSTLMKILMGIYTKDKGQIVFDGKLLENHNPLESLAAGIAMIHQELNLVDQLTISQNIFLGREPKQKNGLVDFSRMNKEAQIIMAELNEKTPVTEKVGILKVAQKQVVEIAKSISSKCKLIVMDEPTAVLTERETSMLFGLINNLRTRGVAVIYISHRLGEVKQICDRVTILRDGCLVDTKDVDSITEHEIANLMVGREVGNSIARPFSSDVNDIVLEVRHVTDNLLKDVSFKVRRGEILGFSGLVGAGRTELMEFIFGLRKVKHGELFLSGKKISINSPTKAIRHSIGFATEDRKKTGVVAIRSISDNINYCYFIKNVKAFLNRKKIENNNTEMIERLKIVCNNSNQLVNSLSGGNQQKVVLAKWLLVNSEVLILDEPTRGIDVGAREEIYQIINALSEQGKTVIIISSDLPEILKICPRIIIMYEGKVTGEVTGVDRTENNIMALASNLQLAK